MRATDHLKNLIMAVALAIGITWVTDREPPVTYHYVQALYEDPLTGGVKPVAGGDVAVEFDVTRDRICRTRAERWFRDFQGFDYDLPNEEFTPDQVGEFKLKKKVSLDRRIVPGMGTLKIDVFWYCNPVHYVWPLKTTIRVPVVVEMP